MGFKGGHAGQRDLLGLNPCGMGGGCRQNPQLGRLYLHHFFAHLFRTPNKVGPATTSATTGLFKVYIRHVLAVDPVHKQKQPSVCPVQQLDLLMKRGYRPLSLGQRLISSTRTSSAFDKRKTEIPFVFLSLSAAVVCVLALRSSCKSLSLKGRRRMETT